MPQLWVDFQATADGGEGGMNGSVVIFDTNRPYPKNVLDIASVELSWTACYTNEMESYNRKIFYSFLFLFFFCFVLFLIYLSFISSLIN